MPRSSSVKRNKKLWSSIKNKWVKSAKGGAKGKTSARKMQLATKEYQKRGGKYGSAVKRKSTSLYNWSQPKRSRKRRVRKSPSCMCK